MNYVQAFAMIEHHCLKGSAQDIDAVMKALDSADLPTTRAVDFYLGKVETESGIRRLEHYLFQGTQIQRNYCTLYFARRNEWTLINSAYAAGLIDRIQAYSR